MATGSGKTAVMAMMIAYHTINKARHPRSKLFCSNFLIVAPGITISIWNPKGGQGKSMIAINLAAAAVQIGLKPVLVDQDLQGTLKLYDKAGHLPFDVLLDYPKSKK